MLVASARMNVLPPAVLEALLLQINKAADQHVVDLVLDKRLLVRTSRDGVFYRDPGTETVQERLLLKSLRVWYPPRHQDFNDLPNAYRIVGFDNGRFRLTCAGLLGSLWSDVQVTVTDDFNNAVVQWPVRVRLALNPDELLIPGAVEAARKFVDTHGRMPEDTHLLLRHWKLKIDVDLSELLPDASPDELLPLGSVVKAGEAHVCGHCGGVFHSMKKCSACKNIRYCSKDCQQKHWCEHKQECTYQPAHKCGYCGERGHSMKVCSVCKNIRYCSRQCQKKDWGEHKNECAHRHVRIFCDST